MRSKYIVIGIVVGVLLSSVVVVLAGNLNSPGPPTDTASESYSLKDIYDRLNAGTDGAKSAFTEPAAGPGSTMNTLNEIMGKAPEKDDTDGAVPGEVLAGKKYWGLRTDGSGGSSWGLETGSAAAGSDVNGSDGAKTFNIPDGFYAGSKTCTANDAQLLAGNIKQGVNVFGVDGTLSGGSTYNAGVPQTGQTMSYATGDDGDLEKGVAWPSPRFTDNGNGTVKDNLTGLIWLKDGDCMGTREWSDALTQVINLNAGTDFSCDSYTAGTHNDWRLPNVRELYSLIDSSQPTVAPWIALPSGHPFTGVQSAYYWSSTSYASGTSGAWSVDLYDGYVFSDSKTFADYVWPVRGG